MNLLNKIRNAFLKIKYYSIFDFIDALGAFINIRYLLYRQRFFGRYIIRNAKNIDIGLFVKAYNNFFVEAHGKAIIKIGDRCIFNRNAYITSFEQIVIESDCLFGPNLFIGDHEHGTYSGEFQSDPAEYPVKRPIQAEEIHIGSNVWVGANVTITKGVKIGFGSIIGANSVVTKDIPRKAIAAGIPAKVIKKFSEDKKQWLSRPNYE